MFDMGFKGWIGVCLLKSMEKDGSVVVRKTHKKSEVGDSMTCWGNRLHDGEGWGW